LTKKLQVLEKNIQGTKVDGENAQVFKYLKVTMDKYVLHLPQMRVSRMVKSDEGMQQYGGVGCP
jgi:hypothetical protein